MSQNDQEGLGYDDELAPTPEEAIVMIADGLMAYQRAMEIYNIGYRTVHAALGQRQLTPTRVREVLAVWGVSDENADTVLQQLCGSKEQRKE